MLPDELVGAAELLVSKATGATIGVHRERYLLLQPHDGATLTSAELRARLAPLLPADLGIYRRVQVRAPGETPYFRSGDAVLPPVMLKSLFGEFAGATVAGTSRLPGHRPRLGADAHRHRERSAARRRHVQPRAHPSAPRRDVALQRRGLGSLIQSYAGCFAPKFVNRDPTAMLSPPLVGHRVRLQLPGQRVRRAAAQDPRLVRTMERFGFIWGGTFIVPDGNHFEYRRAEAPSD